MKKNKNEKKAEKIMIWFVFPSFVAWVLSGLLPRGVWWADVLIAIIGAVFLGVLFYLLVLEIKDALKIITKGEN